MNDRTEGIVQNVRGDVSWKVTYIYEVLHNVIFIYKSVANF